MKQLDLLNEIDRLNLYYKLSWFKDYENNSRVAEYKILKNSYSKKPLAFIQIGFYNHTYDVISCGVTFYGNVGCCYEITNINDLNILLNKIKI